MAVAQRQASPTPSPQHLQCDSQALIALAAQITMAVAHKHTLPTSVPQPFQCDSEPVRTLVVEITMAVAHRDMLQTSVPQPLQCDSEPVRTLAAQIPMAIAHNHNGSPFWRLWILRLPRGRQPAAPAATTRAAAPSGGSGYCACHAEDSQRRQRAPQPLLEALGTAPARRQRAPQPFLEALGTAEDRQRHQRRQRAPQPLLEALGTAPATRKTAGGASGDNARRSPFWRLWVLRLPRGQPAAPAATTRAAAPSKALGTAPATKTASGTSGDNARRSPFWRLWVLRLPQRQQAAPAATTRAAAPSGGSGYCACHEEDSKRHQRRQRAPQPRAYGGSGYCACHEDRQRHQRRQRAPQPLLEALGTAPATKTASGTSGDNARRSPFWRLWVLRLPRGRQQAAPAATTRAAAQSLWRLWVLRLPRGQPAAPAATTRAAAPSGGSGYCACHKEDSQRHQRRQRAPQPLLEALGAPATRKTAGGASGDNARRSPFWRLWVLHLPRGQPAAPAATTRAAAPSGGSGYCACHEDSKRHQRRQRAPQPLLEALGTAPATKTASGTSGDNARRSPFWRLWVLRLPRGRQPAAPAATTRAAAPSGGSGYCACHEDSQRRQRAPQPLLEALDTAPATRNVEMI